MIKDKVGSHDFDDVFLGVDEIGRVQLLNEGELPFVHRPGKFLPPDQERDRMLLEALRHVGGDEPIKKGAALDYNQSKALYSTVRTYFEKTDPLMNTERWMAEYVEKNGITYTDHDGRRYVMKGGVRHLVR